MRAPSIANLTSTFGIPADKAKLIRELASSVDNADGLEMLINSCCPGTEKYVRSMHSSPYRSGMWRRTVVLHAIDKILDGHGVEPLGPVSMQGPPYEYINMGDTYNTTLIYKKSTDSLSIGSWGDIAEKHPNW